MYVHNLPKTQGVCLGKILIIFCLHKSFTLSKTAQNLILSPQTKAIFYFAFVLFIFFSKKIYKERKHSTLGQCEEFLFY